MAPGSHLVGINTGRPNALVTEAIQTELIPELSGYSTLRREIRYGVNSRIDVLLSGGKDDRDCYVEVKNVHLLRETGSRNFRTVKPSAAPSTCVSLRAWSSRVIAPPWFFLCSAAMPKASALRPISIPAYAAAFRTAAASGVEMLCYRCRGSPSEIAVEKRLEIADLS